MHFVQLLLPDFALILCGFLVCRYTALGRPVWEQVESLVYFFLFPVLLFQSIVRSPLDLGATSSYVEHELPGFSMYLDTNGIQNFDKERVIQALNQAAEKLRDKVIL